MNPWESNDFQPPVIKTPAVNHVTSGVVVPGLQAVITGLLCGLAALAITAWFKLPFWAIGGTVAAVIMAGSWLAYRSRWQWVVERVLGVDLDNDGYIGPPQQPLPPALPETITVHLTKSEGLEGQFIPLPHPDKIPALAQTVLEGRAFNQTAMVGTGKLFTRAEYDAVIDAMIAGGLMRYRNPDAHNAGIVCTAAGRAVLRRFLPSPTAQDGE